MTAISLGPFVLAGGRLAAFIALVTFLFVTEAIAWYRRRQGLGEGFGSWPLFVVAGWVFSARAGYVIANPDAFGAAPLDILKLWQGGFTPRTGAYGAIFVIAASALARHRLVLPLATAAILAGLTSQITMLSLSGYRPANATLMTTASFADLDGKKTPLSAPGQPVVLNLWASWCGPCRREMPMLQDIARKTPNVTMRFVDEGESAETVRGFLFHQQLSGTDVRLDPTRSLMTRYLSIGLPATLFFRPDGTLAFGQIGEISRAEVLRQIAVITAAPPQ